jgi:hypothetical protein
VSALSRSWRTFAALLVVTAFTAWQAIVGADAFWVVALGRHILDTGTITHHIPFAAAPSDGWHNVPVLAELLFAASTLPSDRGLLALQGAAGFAALLVLAVAALRRGARDARVAAVVLLVATMSLQALVVVRLQMLSLVPFALLMVVLTRQAQRPTRSIWLLPALVAVWANLHGAVLVGVAVAGCHLLVSRLHRRPAETIAVGVTTLGALFLTPAGRGTFHYYVGVFSNEAAKRGSELWSAPDPRRPFDALLLGAGLVLLVLFLRSRRAAWEYVVAGVLVTATLIAARNGVWLALGLFLLATGTSQGVRSTSGDGAPTPTLRRPSPVPWLAWSLVAVAVWTAILAAKEEVPGYVPGSVVTAVRDLAGPDGVVLATEPGVEQLAADGLTVWVSDPIDAFAPADQATYLDFLAGDPAGRRAWDSADVVAVEKGRPALGLVEADQTWRTAQVIGDWHLFVRESPR